MSSFFLLVLSLTVLLIKILFLTKLIVKHISGEIMDINKYNYQQIAERDVNEFLECLETRSETSDFRIALMRAYSSLQILYQVIYG